MAKEFSPSEHYFKVDKRILEIASVADLKKSELLVYLHHSRAKNPKGRFLNCSVAGINAMSKNLCLDECKIKEAEKGLIEKYLIKKRPDVKTGYFKTIATEILPFPLYEPPADKQCKSKFKLNSDKDNTSFIQLPSSLIDKHILSSKMERQYIFALIYLYSLIDWQAYWGVDYNIVKICNKGKQSHSVGTFGNGFNAAIYKKDCQELEIDKPETVISPTIDFKQGDLKKSIQYLIDNGIFKIVPVIFEVDVDEPDILRKKQMIYKGLVHFRDNKNNENAYRYCPDKQNDTVYWIVQPNEDFIVQNNSYLAYKKLQEESNSNQSKLYREHDFITDIDKHIKLFNDERFWEWLNYKYSDVYSEIEEKLGENLYDKYIIKNEIYEEEYLVNTVLPLIPNDVKRHYNNYIKAVES